MGTDDREARVSGGRPARAVIAGAPLLTMAAAMLMVTASAADPAPAGLASGPGRSGAAATSTPGVTADGTTRAGGSRWVMPAAWLDTANIAWIATDPPDPPATPDPSPTPTPTPTPLPATTPRAGMTVPAGAFRVPVLMYHLITAPVPSYALEGLVVSPTLFDAQLHALKDAGWNTMTAAQLSAALTAGTPPPAKTMVVTFDDGYADGYANALPILQRYGFHGTFYVITDRIGTPPFLDEGMVRILARAGMEVANHTRQHVDLAAVSYANALAQISGANDAIQQLTGIRPTTLAYPYGSVNTTAVKAAADAGITLATTTVEGCVEYPANRLSAPRIRVSPSMSASYLLATLQPCIGG